MPGGGFVPLFQPCATGMPSERTILHSDLNSFFASVECVLDPSIAAYPVAVCGSVEERHGIVLAKNQLAKKYGIATGDTVMTAKAKCPYLKIASPNYEAYEEYSHRVQKIYNQITDLVESFGIDECWLDVTGSSYLFGSGEEIAERIRREVKNTTGLTVSVGVSFCKVFSKLGSDMKKPDAVTTISRSGFREKIWDLPASSMLGVGPATAAKLAERSVHTIGQLARTPPELLCSYFGKNGKMLWAYANGLDASPVVSGGGDLPMKSVGHGTTPPADLKNNEEAETLIVGLALDIGRKLRLAGMSACSIAVAVRDNMLIVREFSAPLPRPTQSAEVLAEYAYKLFCSRYNWENDVRSLTVRAINLIERGAPRQLDIFEPSEEEDKRDRLCETIDMIQNKFGRDSLIPAKLLKTAKIKEFGYSACKPADKSI